MTPEEELRKIKTSRSGLGWNRLPNVAPAPDILIDAGAGYGTNGLYRAFPRANLIMIDALEENRAALESHAGHVIISAIGSSNETRTINIAGNANGSRSSFLPRQGAFEQDTVRMRDVPVARLDSLIEPGTGSIGLKLDIEGYEIEAIKGAEALLPRILWIVAETSLSPRFKGDPLFAGVYSVLDELGFVFRDIVSIRRNKGGDLRMIDSVFVKRRP